MNVREWALPVYTILMQLAIGALFALWILRFVASTKFKSADIDRIARIPVVVIVFTAAVAMIAAHFHLSKPFLSFLAVRNFKTSWLSREIVFTVILFWLLSGLLFLSLYKKNYRKIISTLGWLAIVNGTILIYCMASIYLLPTQVAWNSNSVIVSFYVTALLLGTVALACLMLLDLKFAEIQKNADIELRVQWIRYSLGTLAVLGILLSLTSVVITNVQMALLKQGGLIAQTSLNLLLELYLPLLVIRQVLPVGASLFMGITVHRMYRQNIAAQKMLIPVYLSCLLILIGEIVGRFLFYAAHIRVGL